MKSILKPHLWRRHWWLAALAVALLLPVGSTTARTTTCEGTLGDVRVENLNVPEDASCVLDGTVVEGNIDIDRDATLHASGVEVRGNIDAHRAYSVVILSGSEVRGNIEIRSTDEAQVDGVKIYGNLTFVDNDGPVEANGSAITGNLKADDNRDGVLIVDNDISGNLECRDNRPAPSGFGNQVGGNAKGQCADLDEPPPTAPTPTSPPPVPTNTPPAPTSTPPAPVPTPTPTGAPSQPDLQPPAVVWIAPVQVNERFDVLPGAAIVLEAGATDNLGNPKVTFLAWDALAGQYIELGSSSQAPYRVQIPAGSLNPGWNQIFTHAVDQAGNSSDYPYIWLYQYSHALRLPFVVR